MTEFKLLRLIQLQVLLLLLAVTGCVKAQRHALNTETGPGGAPRNNVFRMSGGANNFIDVDISRYQNNIIQSGNLAIEQPRDVAVKDPLHASYTTRREYPMVLCDLKDLYAQQPLVGQKFTVYSELEIKDKNLTIQANNCMYFQVSIPFDFFADSVNLEVNFIFLAAAGSPAMIHKTVIFNPWDKKRGDNPEFYDYTFRGQSKDLENLPHATGTEQIMAALEGKLSGGRKKLEVGGITIFPVDKQYLETNMVGAGLDKEAEAQKAINEAKRAELQRLAQAESGGTQPAYEAYKSLDLHLMLKLTNLMVRLYDSAGNNKDMPLTTGRYRIYGQLVATDLNNKDRYIITDKLNMSYWESALNPNNSSLNNKKPMMWDTTTMGVNAVLPISIVIRPQWGTLNLVLRVEPVDLGGQIEPFEAVYSLGRFSDLSGGKSPIFSTSEYPLKADGSVGAFSYEDYIKKSKPPEQAKGVSTLEAGFRRFQFTALNVLFSRIMAGDTATDRTIQYTVETCVIDNFTGQRPGAGLIFDIETEDRKVKTVIQRQTNELGCLNWVGMISHKVYHRENLVEKVSKLTYRGGNGKDLVYNLSYYINPWDEKFTFGRDSRILPQEYIDQVKAQQAVAPPTRILLTDFKYDATGFRYVIDRYMNMTVKKTVLMTIHPKILKYNSIVWGRSGASEVRDGIYLMKIAMQKDYLDPAAPGREILFENGRHRVKTTEKNLDKKQFLVIKEMLIRVLGGLIITPVEFDITDLRTLRIRSQMMIQIETIDEMLLRAVFLADKKLGAMIEPPGSSKTQEIIDLQTEGADLDRRIDEINLKSQQVQLADTLAELQRANSDLKDRLASLLKSLDPKTLEVVLSSINKLRLLGEQGVSTERNQRYTALNNIIKGMKRNLTNKVEKQTLSATEKYAASQAIECAKTQLSLQNQGKTAEAKRWDPEHGDLCITEIPKDELFYYLVSGVEDDTDAILKTLFTTSDNNDDAYVLYKAGGLRDDFTNAYVPDYDFSLLSNEGDEKAPGVTEEMADHVSGLPRRTFIGPVTFVLNGNSSAMRPTDVLDEASCEGTCAQLDGLESEIINADESMQAEFRNFALPVNSAYERSPYFGSIRHFYKKQVNDLIAMERGLRFQYHQEMQAFSQVGNLLESFALNYVSFSNNAPKIKKLDYNCYAEWKMGLEETYSKWRDATPGAGESLPYNVKKIPDSCFLQSGRVIAKNAFVGQLNKDFNAEDNKFRSLLRLDEVNTFSSTKNLNLNLAPVTEQDLKKFAKNGLYAQDLDFDTKINILHKFCHYLRGSLVPANGTAYKKTVEDRMDNYFKASGGIPSMDFFRGGVVNEHMNNMKSMMTEVEKTCHNRVINFGNAVRPYVGKVDDVTMQDILSVKMREIPLPIVVERKVRVLETSNQYIYKDGKTINYSVGTGFTLSNSFTVNRGMKVDPFETVEKLLGLVSKTVNTFFGAFAGMVNFNWGMTEAESKANGTSVSSGTTIAGQISTLDIQLKKWEKCSVVRFDENFLIEQINGIKSKQVGPFYNERADLQGLGTMLCSGDVDSEDDNLKGEPLRVRERYYYFTQIFNEGDMQDPGALFNHPWMLQLRGVRDFTAFHKALTVVDRQLDYSSAFNLFGSDLAMIASSLTQEGDKTVKLTPMEVVSPDDVQKALDMMAEAYRRSLPTFPSMYTFSDTSQDRVTDWPAAVK